MTVVLRRSLPWLVALLIATPLLCRGQADLGPLPIPCFTQSEGGGTGPITVTFDPSCTYLPVSPDPAHLTYLYQAVWDFGDGSPPQTLTGGPVASMTQALGLISHTFTGDTFYTVTLTINITVQNIATGALSTGPSALTQNQVHVTPANFPPTPVIEMLSSPAEGTLPYTLVVNVGNSFDQDGYIQWAQINWGDGTCDQVLPSSAVPPVTLPSPTPVAFSHTYSAPGNYRVTFSAIDNGRAPLGAVPNVPAGCPDPNVALASIVGVGNTANPAVNPALAQAFLDVTIPGNLTVTRGGFKVIFSTGNSDSFDVLFHSNVTVDNIVNAAVVLSIGKAPNTLTFPTFHTDAHGKFSNQAQGLLFDFNAKKMTLHVKVGHATLAKALGAPNATIVNGGTDVPVSAVINGTTAMGATVRFAYKSKLGDKGIGSDARNKPQ